MPIALWCVLLAGIMPVVMAGVAKWGPGLDNRNPRDWANTLVGHRRRAYAAHQNSYEAFPFFAAAVLAAMLMKAPQGTIDTLAVLFVAARIGYAAAYVADTATLRSVLWIVGWLTQIAILTSPAWAV